MLEKLFSAPWVDQSTLLPPPVQHQAAKEISIFWRTRGWQLVLGEFLLWAVAEYQNIPQKHFYLALAGFVAVVYALGFMPSLTLLWLIGSIVLFLAQGLMIGGLGAVTALTYIVPYTFAGMLLNGRKRVIVQAWCIGAFWVSLIYEVVPLLNQLQPPSRILVGYNILLAAFVFQTLRFLNQLAVRINTAYVAEQVRGQSQHFLARVSHELRTPLNSVLGFAKLLKRGKLTESQAGYLDQIIEESEQLNRLVSDLLDSAHLNTGKVTLNREMCNINTLCESVVEEQHLSLNPNVVLELELDAALSPIYADSVRLRQALSNLVSNAVKYTEQGEIVVKTTARGETILIEIRDTGIGIPEAQRELIFVPFVQLDSRRIGVGLGLDIALQLVRLHGGDIRVQSVHGQGSIFTIELPKETKET
jgi:signal transduction histidine kinase